ncbi:exodeoxyribonuclease VII large subunit [Candidatus Kinetoplastibacterium blastocrithidii TCC012E]|uniref:Exodeoxyribonuclease 7 large subunit n=1 Tax=Candidatus Kinetoplastidibacterium blastocrithidiae TCC012E TaxID=1208922 RepID=M1MD92_9PROT|nr:exodeoxyribonuclease VII large subunit [Candidatus Kinetoplastibacterium blastocrithidii]AFZ83600.1 exodeoxyribonuclease VII large subunit [Candidatus Kinetoplastibacterium blastocrithidii (ex Strigomonas culicis)]AGF49720.1 exodeoxyribonuclease VII large subunit [Candidatus Kinetoplastibacterium blastocrithidii TCC012E]
MKNDSNDDLDDIFTVSGLNKKVSLLLENEISLVWVKGEVSNFIIANSGHWYFTMKDSIASVKVVMFKSRANAIKQKLKDGDEIEIYANASLYVPRGEYQLQSLLLRKSGIGRLHEKFLALKNKLSEEGLFKQANRLPKLIPVSIGIITSLNTAALRDVLVSLNRRAPYVKIVIYPTPVQGIDASLKILEKIITINNRMEVDTLLLVRGGGSLEDLWCFNDESLARVIANSSIPIISGIGHETDFTIADFASDLRAPTPTAAAELSCSNIVDLTNKIKFFCRHIYRSQRCIIDNCFQCLDILSRRIVSPLIDIKIFLERINVLKKLLASCIRGKLVERRSKFNLIVNSLHFNATNISMEARRLFILSDKLRKVYLDGVASRQAVVQSAMAIIHAFNPENILHKGYSVVRDINGNVIKSYDSVSSGQKLEIQLSDGFIETIVYSSKNK